MKYVRNDVRKCKQSWPKVNKRGAPLRVSRPERSLGASLLASLVSTSPTCRIELDDATFHDEGDDAACAHKAGTIARIGGRMVSQARQRMQTDVRLAVISLCGLATVVSMTPFGIYRFATGNVLAGMVNLLGVSSVLLAVTFAWVTGRAWFASHFLLVAGTVGCFTMVLLPGTTGDLWTYPIVLMNYFLVERRRALLASTLLILAVVIHGSSFGGLYELTGYAVTVSMVNAYAFVFASRTDRQRRVLEDLVSLDPLTGAGNRRSMEADLGAMVATPDRRARPWSIVILDLDHFKRINDTHGHDAGDRVLRDFVAEVRRTLRRGDRLYRYGGEEFVLLLSDTDAPGVNVVLQKLRLQIARGLRSPTGAVTVSMGVAQWHDGEDWTSTLSRADAALYMAKAAGRDRIVFGDPQLESGHVAHDEAPPWLATT